MDSDHLYREALTTGTQNSTVIFLNSHHLIAMTIFIVAIMSANLWTYALIEGVDFVSDRGNTRFIKSLVMATIFTFFSYFLIVYVFKVPITAAFSF